MILQAHCSCILAFAVRTIIGYCCDYLTALLHGWRLVNQPPLYVPGSRGPEVAADASSVASMSGMLHSVADRSGERSGSAHHSAQRGRGRGHHHVPSMAPSQDQGLTAELLQNAESSKRGLMLSLHPTLDCKLLLGRCADPGCEGQLSMDVWPGCKHVSMMRINFDVRLPDAEIAAVVTEASGAPCSQRSARLAKKPCSTFIKCSRLELIMKSCST